MKTEPMEKQPPEWEEQLKDVTKEMDHHEYPFEPNFLNRMQELSGENPIGQVRDIFSDADWLAKIAELKSVVRKKMSGVRRNCMLMMLSTGEDCQRIATKLRVSYSTVKRHIEAGNKILKDHYASNPHGEFPSKQGERPVVKTCIFPLDTDAEKREFQRFVNRHVTTHIAYSADQRFREALVVYLKGAKASRYLSSVE